MIDFRKSIINLHKKFPEKSIDELIEIIDCIILVGNSTLFNGNGTAIRTPKLSDISWGTTDSNIYKY